MCFTTLVKTAHEHKKKNQFVSVYTQFCSVVLLLFSRPFICIHYFKNVIFPLFFCTAFVIYYEPTGWFKHMEISKMPTHMHIWIVDRHTLCQTISIETIESQWNNANRKKCPFVFKHTKISIKWKKLKISWIVLAHTYTQFHQDTIPHYCMHNIPFDTILSQLKQIIACEQITVLSSAIIKSLFIQSRTFYVLASSQCFIKCE